LLKAAIVYVPGSGGNLLSRTLCLSEKTIAIVPKELSGKQPTVQLTAKERYEIYNNWKASNWIETETDIRIWYHTNDQEFVNYQLSALELIDQFHPKQFEDENNRQLLWTNIESWKHLIFIQYQEENLNKIIKLAELKRQDLSHKQQILHNEIDAFKRLTNSYSGYTVNWEDMQSIDTYIFCIDNLSRQLNLTIDLELVEKLWISWKIETDKLLQAHE
jgi:hypothetical protein